MQLKTSVIYRFESKVRGGSCFVFDVHSGKILVTSREGYDSLRMFDQGCSIGETARALDLKQESVQGFVNLLTMKGFMA